MDEFPVFIDRQHNHLGFSSLHQRHWADQRGIQDIAGLSAEMEKENVFMVCTRLQMTQIIQMFRISSKD